MRRLWFSQPLIVVAPFDQMTRAATALPTQIAMLIHPDMVLLDPVGPHDRFPAHNGCRALVWRIRGCGDDQYRIADRTNWGLFRMSRGPHLLFVPGGLKGGEVLTRDVLAGRADACLRKSGRRTRGTSK
jgi:hypothetical protein